MKKKWIRITCIVICIFLIFIYAWSIFMTGKKIAEQYHIPHPAVIGHRGACYWAPETTRPSFQLALAIQPDYIEFDVQRSKDGVLFTFHDDTLARTTNVAEVFPNRINDPAGSFTWEELQKLDSGSWFNQQFPERAHKSFVQQPILSFEEVTTLLATGNLKTGMYLETKSPELYPGIEEQIITMLKEKGWITPQGTIAHRNIILESFNLDSVKKFQELVPKIPRSYLFNVKMFQLYGKQALIQASKGVGCGIGPTATLVYPWLVYPAHQQGLLVHTYTVNKLWQMRSLLWFGVDGFFTDRPELGLKACHRGDIDVSQLLEK